MIKYNRLESIIEMAVQSKESIGQITFDDQKQALDLSEEQLETKMLTNYQVMVEAISSGIHSKEKSYSGLSGGDANKLSHYVDQGQTLTGPLLGKALASALAVAEVNACMGKIVAAPTAGSCGILPACLYTIQQGFNLTDKQIVQAMFTASAIGLVIAKVATVSGAEGGCQAECGSASAMAAGAMIELLGGTPQQVGHGTAIALKSILGLVCDPVAGLVEVPCVKRNAMGVAQAFAATDMALSGIESMIPVDEVIGAMKAIGDEMPVSLKETSEGGLADTKTARRIEKSL